jgi:hypothetical protein
VLTVGTFIVLWAMFGFLERSESKMNSSTAPRRWP